ncbi:ribonucleoside-diphosphate reductase [Sarracenia purpurea var. burkii]
MPARTLLFSIQNSQIEEMSKEAEVSLWTTRVIDLFEDLRRWDEITTLPLTNFLAATIHRWITSVRTRNKVDTNRWEIVISVKDPLFRFTQKWRRISMLPANGIEDGVRMAMGESNLDGRRGECVWELSMGKEGG